MVGLETCCVKGCTLKASWRMVWYQQPKLEENPQVNRERQVARKRYVCDSNAHILSQRSPRYPDVITNIETDQNYYNLIIHRADLYKISY